ncbi:MAG TPA: VOC family protein [Pirellulales bacterium]
MTSKIFVNFPVKNLAASIEFYNKLGYRTNPKFTDETAASIVVNEHIYVMLLTEKRFQDFIPHGISDAKKATEVLVALSLENRAAVDEIVAKAVAAGGVTFRQPEDHGFMYGHAFQDLDGHIWEPFWMDPTAAQG